MNKNIGIALALLLSFNALAVRGEEAAEIPPPTMPLLRRMPSAAEWTVTIRKDREKAGDEVRGGGKKSSSTGDEDVAMVTPGTKDSGLLEAAQIMVTKQGDIIRERVLWTNGKTTEKWIVEGQQFREGEHNGEITKVMDPRKFYDPDYSDYSKSDFEACEWINMKSYKGVQRFKGKPYYVFETTSADRTLTNREEADRILLEGEGIKYDPSSNPTRYLVLLDVDKQLPLFSDDGSEVRVYEYSQGTPEALVLPERFAKALSEWKAEVARQTRKFTPP